MLVTAAGRNVLVDIAHGRSPAHVSHGNDAADRRRSMRYAADVPVNVTGHASHAPGITRSSDLCDEGMCLRTRAPIPTGTDLELEVEVIMPTKVCLGFDVDSLIIDGPSVSHFARLKAVVRRCREVEENVWELGVEFLDRDDPETARVIGLYLDHLRDGIDEHYL